VLRSAARRLLILFAVIFAGTSVVSLALGALAHANLLRSLAVGFYVVGAVVLVGSFILGMRGPLRSEFEDERGELAPARGMLSSVLVPRSIRRTTVEERQDARRTSLALFGLGILLIFIGAGFDPAQHVF
jgi:type IV secretory pathway protease TraF